MKTKYIISLISILAIVILTFGLKDKNGNYTDKHNAIISSKKLDANTISTWFKNYGSFNDDPVTGNAGFEWPKGSTKTARYYSGLCLGGLVNNDTLVTVAWFDEEYVSGYTDAGGNPQGVADSNYRIYKLDYGVNNNDRIKWPNILLGNSSQGAPVYFDSVANQWKPLDMGSQTMFMSFTDSDTSVHHIREGSTSPLKADIKMLNFVNGGSSGPLAHTILTEYKIINRGNKVWNNFYISIFSDDDIGSATDDLYGCDSNLSMAYMYNGTNNDPVYGIAPPAVGFIILKGGTVYTGNNNDTLKYCSNKTTVKKVGYRELGMSVSRWIEKTSVSGWREPRNYGETYNSMIGKYANGDIIFHPSGYPTTFTFSGDPVTNTGWLLNYMTDHRYIISTGPVTMNPNDTQNIVIAQVIAKGNNNLNSITVLRQYAQEVWNYYKSCYTSLPISIQNNKEIVLNFRLYQNYPNPFNPISKIRYSVPSGKYQIAKFSFVTLKIYDVLGKEVVTLVNEQQKPGTYNIDFDGMNYPSGVYFYELTAGDFKETKRMVLLK